jgi:ppGpp synthetase/RelA/SpoT-type nucleotidyltranferase
MSLPEIRPRADQFARDAAAALKQRMRESGLVEADRECMIAWRIKSEDGIRAKEASAVRRGKKPFVNDYIGLRVVAAHFGQIPQTLDEIRRWADEFRLEEQEVDDKYQRPGVGGYRAIHLDYLPIDPNPWLLPKDASVEVQLTSWLQSVHGALSHRLVYKAVQSPSADVIRGLEAISNSIVETDQAISNLWDSALPNR